MKWWWVLVALLVGFFGGRLLAPDAVEPESRVVPAAEASAEGAVVSEVATVRAGSNGAVDPRDLDATIDERPLSVEWFESLEDLPPFDQIGTMAHHLRRADVSDFPRIMDALVSGDYGRMGWQMRNLLGVRWADIDPQGMLSYAREQPGNRSRGLMNTLFAAWAKSDVPAAFAAARQLESRREQQTAVQSVVNSIAGAQPERAIALARDFYGENLAHQGQWVFRSIFQNWAREDGEAARASALAMEGGAMKSAALAGSMADWMESDPLAALGWLDSLPVDSSVHGSRKQVFRRFLNNDFDVAKEYVESLKDASKRKAVLENLRFNNLTRQKDFEEIEAIVDWIGTVAKGQVYDSRVGSLISAMTRNDPDSAMDFVLSMRPGNARMSGLGSLGSQLAMSDPVAALAFVNTLPYEDEKQRVLNSMGWALARAPVELSSRLVGAHEDPMVQQKLAPRIAKEWADYDIAGALAWSESLSDERASESAVSDVLGRWIESDPAGTLAYIEGKIEADAQGMVLQRAYNNWARSDPEAAVEWLDRLPEGAESQRSSIYSTVANAYIQHDPMAASEWISGLDAGPERDQSVERLVNSIAKTDPEAGFLWAGTMANADKRRNSLRRSVQAWKEADPEAAYQAIVDADIEADDKEPLLKLFE